MNDKLEIMLVAGEASGDEHGALLVEELRKSMPTAHFFGMGGTAMREVGVETVVDSEESASVMGLTEVVRNLSSLISAFKTLYQAGKQRKPSLVIFIDFPDFNMLLMRALRKHVERIAYYITPQVWAWRSYRAEILARYTDMMLPIFPFEPEFYRKRNIEVSYVGHPFATREGPEITREAFCQMNELDPERRIMAILPGSRRAEIERLAVLFSDVAVDVLEECPDIQLVVPVANSLEKSWLEEQFSCDSITYIDSQAWELLHFSYVSLIASGTATMEAALAKQPFVMAYKVSPMTYHIGKKVVKGVTNFAMPNLIAGRRVVPELMQEQASRERVGFEVKQLLRSEIVRERMLDDLEMVVAQLDLGDGKTPAERAAEFLLGLMEVKEPSRGMSACG